MIIRMEDAVGSGAGQAVTFSLTDGDTVHILHPEQIVAYRGPSSGRSDRLMNVKGIYRKKKPNPSGHFRSQPIHGCASCRF